MVSADAGPVTARPRAWRGRVILRAAVPAALIAAAFGLARRAPSASAAGSLPGFRNRVGTLLAARAWRITAASVASHLMLWLVLLACLRAVSLS